MNKILTLIMAIGLMCSCHETRQSNNYQSDNSNKEKGYSADTVAIRQKELVRIVYRTAEVFHLVYEDDGIYYKDANRTKEIAIHVYDDGTADLNGGGFEKQVMFSRLDGYEYQCFNGPDVYAFNGEL